MKPALHLLLLLFSMLLPVVTTAAGTSTPSMTVEQPSRAQGQFFVITVSDASGRPELFFGGEEYPMFLQNDGEYRALVPVENLMKPGDYAILARQDDWQETLPVKVLPNGMRVQNIWLDKKKQGLTATEEEKAQVKEAIHTLSDLKLWTGTLPYPCKGRKSSPFGVKRSYNGAPVSSYHKGIDITAPSGTPVRNPAEGLVVLIGYENNRFHVHGNTVVIDHGQGLTSIYMHLKSIDVSPGDRLGRGDLIGTVGSTGISTAPHLHWGTYLYGTSVDPELFVRKEY